MSSAADRFAVAFYNIRSGKGIQPLRRAPRALFAESDSCSQASPPLNAWGVGVIQRELARSVRDDPSVVALGLAEAWHCASPARVLDELKWKATSDERNGTALLARFGFAGEPRWRQLDTSRNKNPRDEMWALGAPVCLDSGCARSIDVYVTHWSGTGPDGPATFDKQAQDTIALMSASRGPHLLIGDLNVFEGERPVCGQRPNNTTLGILRQAGYVDAWQMLNGAAEGFTGMLNRAGCGAPEGAPWKRIDYAWSKGAKPIGIRRFGTVPPGYAAPSDHYGLIVEYLER
jgi:endonuclease/exonuclease/phosphatase family metal-dependent hydrolase